MKRLLLISLLILLASCQPKQHEEPPPPAAYVPPVGIPAPPFGINEKAPPRPDPWTAAVPGYYYVEPSNTASNDSNNTYGFPGKPRKTIPLTIPEGSVVEVHGTYNKRHQGQGQEIRFTCTVDRPCYLRGQDAENIPTLTERVSLWGAYGIVEYMKFALNPAITDATSHVAIWPMSSGVNNHHLVIRESEVTGSIYRGGLVVKTLSAQAPATNSYIVYYHLHVHHNGGMDPAQVKDQDMHGIMMNGRVDHVWVLDSELDHNAGDGIQLNGGSSGQANVAFVYVGRVNSHHNKQSGFFTKEAQDVVYSENTIHDHINSSSSSGPCFGTLYAPTRVWILFNHCYGSETFFRGSTDIDSDHVKHPSEIYVLGNLAHDIHVVVGSTTPDDPYARGGFSFACDGPTTRHFINNTLYNFDTGFNCPGGPPADADLPTFIIKNNVLGKLNTAQGAQVNFVDSRIAARSSISYMVFDDPTVRIRWGDGKYRTLPEFIATYPTQCAGCVQGSAKMMDANTAASVHQPDNVKVSDLGAMQTTYIDWATTANPNSAYNYRLQPGSVAMNSGAASEEYARFKELYGIDIAVDLDNNARVAGEVVDVGAYEYASSTPPPDPEPGPCICTPAKKH